MYSRYQEYEAPYHDYPDHSYGRPLRTDNRERGVKDRHWHARNNYGDDGGNRRRHDDRRQKRKHELRRSNRDHFDSRYEPRGEIHSHSYKKHEGYKLPGFHAPQVRNEQRRRRSIESEENFSYYRNDRSSHAGYSRNKKKHDEHGRYGKNFHNRRMEENSYNEIYNPDVQHRSEHVQASDTNTMAKSRSEHKNVTYSPNVDLALIVQKEKSGKRTKLYVLGVTTVFWIATLCLSTVATVMGPWLKNSDPYEWLRIGLWDACKKASQDAPWLCKEYTISRSPYEDISLLQNCMLAGSIISGAGLLFISIAIVFVVCFDYRKGFIKFLIYTSSLMGVAAAITFGTTIAYIYNDKDSSVFAPTWIDNVPDELEPGLFFYLACAATGCACLTLVQVFVFIFINNSQYGPEFYEEAKTPVDENEFLPRGEKQRNPVYGRENYGNDFQPLSVTNLQHNYRVDGHPVNYPNAPINPAFYRERVTPPEYRITSTIREYGAKDFPEIPSEVIPMNTRYHNGQNSHSFNNLRDNSRPPKLFQPITHTAKTIFIPNLPDNFRSAQQMNSLPNLLRAEVVVHHNKYGNSNVTNYDSSY